MKPYNPGPMRSSDYCYQTPLGAQEGGRSGWLMGAPWSMRILGTMTNMDDWRQTSLLSAAKSTKISPKISPKNKNTSTIAVKEGLLKCNIFFSWGFLAVSATIYQFSHGNSTMTWLHWRLWQVSARCLQTHSELLGQPQCRTSHPPHKESCAKLWEGNPSDLPTKSFPKKKPASQTHKWPPPARGWPKFAPNAPGPSTLLRHPWSPKSHLHRLHLPSLVQVLGTRSTVFHCSKLPKWNLFGMNRIPLNWWIGYSTLFPARLQKPHFFAWFFSKVSQLRKL